MHTKYVYCTMYKITHYIKLHILQVKVQRCDNTQLEKKSTVIYFVSCTVSL